MGCVTYACVLTIIVCVLPLLVTPYANMVPLMPSIEDCTTLSLVLAYTYIGEIKNLL